MKKIQNGKFVLLVLLVAAVVATVETQKHMKRRSAVCEDGVCAVPSEYTAAKVTGPQNVPLSVYTNKTEKKPLPQLIDFGSGKCIPCKMMNAVLDELVQEMSGKLNIRVVDVNEQTALAEQYAIRMIPTQIFLDAQGNELFRHEGFIPKEDILKKWKELGFEF